MENELTAWPLVWVMIKMSAVLLFAAALNRLLRQYSASVRSMVWAVAILIQPAIIITGFIGPEVNLVPSLPKFITERFVLMRIDEIAVESPLFKESLGKVSSTIPVKDGQARFSGSPYIAELSAFSDDSLKLEIDPLLSGASEKSDYEKKLVAAYQKEKVQRLSLKSLKTGLISLWSFGALVILLPLLIARYKVMGYRSERVSHNTDIARVWTGVGTRGRELPNLCLSNEAHVPFACGIRNPAIVLPKQALSWSPRRLKSTLLHELAHIERRDPLIRNFSSIVRACFWFNPLLWFAHRELVYEQERACDEQALDAGLSAPDYAEDLLATVDRHSRTPAQALAMAKWSRLGSRIRWVLSDQSKILRLSKKKCGLVLASLCLSFLTIASLGFSKQVKEVQLEGSSEERANSEDKLKNELSDEQMISQLSQYLSEVDGQIDAVESVDIREEDKGQSRVLIRKEIKERLQRQQSDYQKQIKNYQRINSSRRLIGQIEESGAVPPFGLKTYARYTVAKKELEGVEVAGLDQTLHEQGTVNIGILEKRLFREFTHYRKSLSERVQFIDQSLEQLNQLDSRASSKDIRRIEINCLKFHELEMRRGYALLSKANTRETDLVALDQMKSRLMAGEDIDFPIVAKKGGMDAEEFLLSSYLDQRGKLLDLLSQGGDRDDQKASLLRQSLKQLRSQMVQRGLALYRVY